MVTVKRRVRIRPHISVKGLWTCFLPNDEGLRTRNTQFGIGTSPAAAYADYLHRNDLI